jgi:hypothetical protein
MSNRITEYVTFTSSSQEDLDARVAAALTQGWEPQGGLAIGVAAFPTRQLANGEMEWERAEFLYGQAMVRREAEEVSAPSSAILWGKTPTNQEVNSPLAQAVTTPPEPEAAPEAQPEPAPVDPSDPPSSPHDPERVNFEMLPAPAGYTVATLKDHAECEDTAAEGWLMLVPGEWVAAISEKPSPLRTYLRPV